MANSINKDHIAVIVIDKQFSYMATNNIINKVNKGEVNSFDAILSKIDSFVEKCRNQGIKIVWTKMIEDINKSPLNIRTKMISDRTPTISDPESESFEISGLQPVYGEKVIVKKYYDAFAQTDLDEYLKSQNIDTLILVGGYASRCVLGTAFGANGHDYKVILASDLVGNPDKYSAELPLAIGIIDSILGYSIDSSDLVIS